MVEKTWVTSITERNNIVYRSPQKYQPKELLGGVPIHLNMHVHLQILFDGRLTMFSIFQKMK